MLHNVSNSSTMTVLNKYLGVMGMRMVKPEDWKLLSVFSVL